MWEWDEESKGDYDKNNWDFIDLGVGGGTVHHVWIDHCTFTKAYDGIIDTKGGASNVTYSWCKYAGDDGATDPNSFVWQQINALEANKTAYPMYNFLRTRGFSTTDIVTILQGPGKLHAIGEISLDPVNAELVRHLPPPVVHQCVGSAAPSGRRQRAQLQHLCGRHRCTGSSASAGPHCCDPEHGRPEHPEQHLQLQAAHQRQHLH